jgi:hypothetical protein
MRDTATDIAPVEIHDLAAADRMSREIAVLSGRLAHLLATSPAAQDEQIARAHAFLHAMYEEVAGADSAAAARPQGAEVHPLDRLARALALTSTEVDLILLAAMAEEHEGYSSVLRSLNPQNEPYATVGLAAQLVCRSRDDRAGLHRSLENGAAISAGVVQLHGEVPFFEKSLQLAEGLWPVLCGFEVMPASLPRTALKDVAIGLERWLSSADSRRAQEFLRLNRTSLLVLTADNEVMAAHRAAALVGATNRKWVAFEFSPATAAKTVQVALVHALARGAVPIFRLLPGDSNLPPAIPDLGEFPGPVVISASRATTLPLWVERPVLRVNIEPLDAVSRERLWSRALPELNGHAPTLAARYMLEPAVVCEVAGDFRATSDVGGNENPLEGIAECVRARSNTRLAAGVKMVKPSARWEQLVLPPERKGQLTEALQRLIHQATVLDHWKFLEGRPGARGVRMLLSGPPGTGKTLAAEVLAHALGVDLMIVDIARVVSKWIGETEKHLAEAFDAAEQCQAILLFDEADALFGKRTEVSDAHDRYANLETAFLLSRLERFEGMAILSTNLKQNIDPAFLRRLEFVVDFDEPSGSEREALWRCHLPPGAPLADDVDLKELAALYPIVGGLIRNASVAAAFLAASANSAITRNHLVGAVRREYEKAAKSFPGLPAGAVRT